MWRFKYWWLVWSPWNLRKTVFELIRLNHRLMRENGRLSRNLQAVLASKAGALHEV